MSLAFGLVLVVEGEPRIFFTTILSKILITGHLVALILDIAGSASIDVSDSMISPIMGRPSGRTNVLNTRRS